MHLTLKARAVNEIIVNDESIDAITDFIEQNPLIQAEQIQSNLLD